jgi:protein O-mannosyl-transferase
MAKLNNSQSKVQPGDATIGPEIGAGASKSGWMAPYLLFFVLALVLYGNTVRNGYALDDIMVITENQFTKRGVKGLGDIFTTDAFVGFYGKQKDLVAGGRYRPLSIATFAVEVSLFGTEKSPTNPAVSHAINAVIYGLCGILLFAFMRQILPERDKTKWWLGLPFLVTMLFMVHPIHTEVVANIKGRDEIMALMFLFASLYTVMRYLDTSKLMWLGAAAVAFFLGLMSKETPLPFVLILPLTILIFRPKSSWEQILMGSGAVILPTITYLALRLNFVGIGMASENGTEVLNDPFVGVSLMDRLATVSSTMGVYLEKLLFPLKLSHDYYFNQVPVTTWADPRAFVPGLIFAALLGFGIWLAFKRNPIGYGLVFFFLSFSITSNIAISIGTTMGERFVFVPSLGFVIALVCGLDSVRTKVKSLTPTILAASLGIVALAFSVRTVIRNTVWKDNFTLFTTDAEVSPNSAKVQTSAGGILVEESGRQTNPAKKAKMLEEAVRHLKKAIEIYPQHGQAHLLLGNAYYNQDRYQDALTCYENAWNQRPYLWDSYTNAAVTAKKMKRYDVAVYVNQLMAERQQTAGQRPHPLLWFDLGANYEDWGKADSAILFYQKAIDADPRLAKAYGQTARVYGMQLQNFDKAIEFGEKAVEIDPKLDWAWENLGVAHGMKKDYLGAVEVFNRGIQSNPKGAKLYLNLAITYQNLGDTAKAGQNFGQAFLLDPSLKPK